LSPLLTHVARGTAESHVMAVAWHVMVTEPPHATHGRKSASTPIAVARPAHC